ncbi:MAG: putative phosphoribosyl transferase [Paraglaciecola sp.]
MVDDGMATGATILAAIAAVSPNAANKVVVAVHVAKEQTLGRIEVFVAEVCCLAMARPFVAVGCWYEGFSQVSHEDVINILQSWQDIR